MQGGVMSEPRILVLDIERVPNLVYKWSLFDKGITPLSMVAQYARTICFAASWMDSNRVQFYSEFHHGREQMIEQAHRLLDEADITVHYNGDKFDLPKLRKEIMVAGLPVESPSRSVDLLKVVRKLGFESNKLDHIAQELGLGGKLHTEFGLWLGCIMGDPKAWARMRRYNIGDVRLTKDVYKRLLPRIHNHPNLGLWTGEEYACRCGSTNVQKRGPVAVGVSMYQQFSCNDCGGWGRGSRALSRVDMRGIA